MKKTIDLYEKEMLKSLIEIVSIPSVEGEAEENKPFGKAVDDALRYALNLSDEIGMVTKNIDNYAGHADYGDGEETLGIVIHLDVVPASDGWTFEPFKPEIVGNKIYGRGTTDNKGPFIAIMYAIKALIENNIELKRKIRVIFGTNEETRWEGIQYYLQKEVAPDLTIVPDALFPMIYAEKGIVDYKITMEMQEDDIKIVSFTGGNAINSVADVCEIVLDAKNKLNDILTRLSELKIEKPFLLDHKVEENLLKIVVKGIPAHSSEPQTGANAIGYMSKVLISLLDGESNLYKTMSFIHEYFNHKDYLGLALNIATEDEPSGQLTNNVGLISLKENRLEMHVNSRYPVTMDYEKYLEQLQTCIEKNGYSLEVEDHLAPVYKSLDSDESKILIDTYRNISGDYESKPVSIGGGTYARALPNAIAYGGQMQGDPVIPHQNDEYLTIDNLMLMTNIYVDAIEKLANYEGNFR